MLPLSIAADHVEIGNFRLGLLPGSFGFNATADKVLVTGLGSCDLCQAVAALGFITDPGPGMLAAPNQIL